MYSTTVAAAQESGSSWFNARRQYLTKPQIMSHRRPQSSLVNFRDHLSESYDHNDAIEIPDDEDDDDVVITETRAVPRPRVVVDVNEPIALAPLDLEPGCDVELEDHSFFRIVEHVTDDPYGRYIKGYRLRRQNHWELLMPERDHELVHMVKVDNDVNLGSPVSTVAVDSVTRKCKIIFTNQQYRHLNYRQHVLAYSDEDTEQPIFFCRYTSSDTYAGTDEGDPTGQPPVAGRIEHLRSNQADVGALITKTGQHIELQTPDHEARMSWRGEANCVLGGSHVEDRGGIRKQKYTFGDAFCGAGGTSSGALSARLKMRFAFDLDPWAIETYEHNFQHTGTQALEIDVKEFVRKVSSAPEKWFVDFLHMSPPCQPFCGANRRPNKEDDERNLAAFARAADLLELCKPRIVTLEEAKSLTDIDKRSVFKTLISYFIKKGYSIQWKVLDFPEFGVPQTRKRTIIIASGPGEKLPAFVKPTHGNEPSLRTLPTLGATLRSIPVYATHNDEFPKMKKRRDSYDPDNMLCRTVLTAPKDHHYHPSGERRFSIREYAAIQTFPHDFDFEGPYAEKLKQIGNAVPPMFAGEMFGHLKSELRAADIAEARGYWG
ncbi:hypothetical protein H2200_012195 [Cladophialophora chaetospira]|uniref:DNA (cytosine-5-)-methyltransferase n=1 Tax=Cladophialophora chaetospira TaxID=386627 RepID=A0AA38WYG4_9EURO|nr:hypothetical protein H2200_012195 [Cladophialophora chaetospira]